MSYSKIICLAMVLSFCLLVVDTETGWAIPEPALVPPAGTWQLDFELHGDPERIAITLPGDDNPRRFWYLLYTITNNTDKDVEFYPQFELFTDTFKLKRAGEKVRRPIFEVIRKRYVSTLPLLEDMEQVTGRILKGQDNARSSVAIFEDFDPNATRAQIFVAGLTNETVKVDHPIKIDAKTGKCVQVLLRKSLALRYQVAGDRFSLDKRVMLYRGRKWIMR